MRFFGASVKLATFLCVLLGVSYGTLGQCVPTSTLTTYWGSENVVIEPSRPVQSMRGIVTADRPLEGVLVEIYDHPEVVRSDDSPGRSGQKRLAACVTTKNGRFSFSLPQGKYELRLSKPVEWNATSVLVEVRKSGGSRESIKVWLELGH